MTTKTTLTLGIVGRGKLNGKKNGVPLIEDFIESRDPDEIHFVFALTPDWDDTAADLLEWVEEMMEEDAGISWEVIHDQDAKKDKDLKAIIADASSATQVEQVSRKVVAVLEEAEGEAALLVRYDTAVDDMSDDEVAEEPGYAALEAAHERGVPAFDLCDGLEKIEFDDEAPAGASDDSSDNDGGETSYPSRSELEQMDRKTLKKLLEASGLDISPRAHSTTIVDALDRHYRSQPQAAATAKKAEEKAASKAKKEPAAADENFVAAVTDVQVTVADALEKIEERITATDMAIVTLEKKFDSLRADIEAAVASLTSSFAGQGSAKDADEDEEAPRRSRRSRRSSSEDEPEEQEEEAPRRRRRRRA